MAKKSKEDAEMTYQSLLDSAVSLFLEKGIHNTTLQDIASNAGVTRGALYWHFKGKTDIMIGIMESVSTTLNNKFNERITELPDQNAGATFKKHIKRVFELIVKDPRFGQSLKVILTNSDFTEHDTDFQKYIICKKSDHNKAFAVAIEKLIRQGEIKVNASPKHITQALQSYLLGLTDEHFAPESDVDLEKDGETLLDIFLDSIIK